MNEADRKAEAQRWLRYAEEDLAGAKTLAGDEAAVPRQSCWLAQQSAEKAIKSLLIFLGIDFPRSHDLDLLRNLVPPQRPLKTEPADLAELSEWAVEARYPGEWPDPTPQDAAQALATAGQVLRLVRDDLSTGGAT